MKSPVGWKSLGTEPGFPLRAFVATASLHCDNSPAKACQDRLKTSLPGNDSDIYLGDYRAAGSARGSAGGLRGRRRAGRP